MLIRTPGHFSYLLQTATRHRPLRPRRASRVWRGSIRSGPTWASTTRAAAAWPLGTRTSVAQAAPRCVQCSHFTRFISNSVLNQWVQAAPRCVHVPSCCLESVIINHRMHGFLRYFIKYGTPEGKRMDPPLLCFYKTLRAWGREGGKVCPT